MKAAPVRPRGWRVPVAVLAAVLVFTFAFLFRFNALGGSLGGFDNDHFVHMLRSDMVLHGEQPLRDFADAELRGAWPSLGYEVSAWAQRIAGRTLLTEAYLTVGGLAIAAAAVFLLALDLSRRWLVALLAALCVILSGPKLYNYEKVLMLAGAAVLVRFWAAAPTTGRLALLSLWTAVAALFRHDYGVYVGVAAVTAILARGPWSTVTVARRLAAYVAITLLLLTPSLVWVQVYQGLVPYYRATLASVEGESVRTEREPQRIDPAAGFDEDNVTAVTFYAFWTVVVAALAVAVWRIVRAPRPDPVQLATGVALIALGLMANAFFLRNNLNARFGDAVVPVALLGAWMAGVTASYAPRALLGVLLACLFVTGGAAQELRSSGLSDSWEAVQRRFEATRAELRPLPPHTWDGRAHDEDGTLVASRYLAECTRPDDRVLVVTYAPEVPVFARRLFAGGQGTFGLNFYLAQEDQERTVARLRLQSVPVVIGSYDDYEGEFADDYPYVHEFVAARYHDAGALTVEGEPRFRVFVESAREPHGMHPDLGLPCFR